MMKRVLTMVALALATTAAAAQNITKHVDPVETFIGQTRMLGSMGGAWKAGIDAVWGLTINAFDDKPNIYKTELVIRAFNGKRIVGINAGSKLILKAGDTTIYLITPDGSQWDGGEETIVETDAEGGERLSYASEARYPITEADLELLKKHGFRKYRLQVEDNVYEHELDERHATKFAEKLSEAYKEIRDLQLFMAKKVNDLSDF